MKKNFHLPFLTSGLLLCSLPALAADVSQRDTSPQAGILTQLEGKVTLFTHPSKALPAETADVSQRDTSPRALFEGEYYRVRDAKPGDRLERGNILRTSPNGKARVIYLNGDQFTVGPATAYRIFWDKDTVDANTRMNLMYGKVRGVVEKGGPHSKLRIKTSTATMGVRGTDFFIADGAGGTEISIIRGAVEVSTEKTPKPLQIKSGETASVTPVTAGPTTSMGSATQKQPPTLELRKTTQQELAGIQKTSLLNPTAKETFRTTNPEIAKTIEKLEKKAVETTLKDVKTHDPKLFAQLQDRKIQSADEVNTTALREVAKEAPKAPESHKPSQSEMEDLGGGAYEKYFKVDSPE